MNKSLLWAVAIFIFGTPLSCICSGRWLLNGEMNIINALASFNTINVQAYGGWAIPKNVLDFFNALITAFTWNYPFLSSPWAIFIKMVLWLVSIAVIWALIEMAKYAVDGIVSAIRTFH